MKMNKNIGNRIFAVGFGLGLLATAAFGAQPQAVLGSDGELYVMRAGAYGDLFPGGRSTDKAHPVLALDITRPEQAPTRALVPATADLAGEISPSMVFEHDSGRLFLLWESRTTANSVLKLASFDGTKWSQAFSVIGNPFSQKGSPQLAITRDVFTVRSSISSDTSVRHRTILHVIWVEEAANGFFETYYTPVILENGSYVGKSQVYRLSDYDNSNPVAGSPSPDLMRSPSIQAGRDERSVVAGFVSTASRRLVTLEIDVLPEELGQIAEVTRATIIDTGITLKPENRGLLADQVKKSILDHGTAFHTEVLDAMADRVRALILDDGSQDLVSLGETTRATIIDTGARFSGRGLRSLRPSVEKIEEAHPEADASPHAVISTAHHLLRFREISSRVAPPVGAGSFTLFLSKTGEDVVVAWPASDRVLYHNSQEEDWSEKRELKLTNGMTLDRAFEILSQRVR